ncbi:energy transducer TonB family protein [Roseobacteraceae bacterium NS-SX3]
MKRAAELTAFTGLAVLIHLALFAAAPRSGAQSSGETAVSVRAADATVAEMVEAWERPPEARPQLDADLTPPPAPAAPSVPQFDLPRAPRAAAQLALAKPAPAGVPEADTAPPPRPPEPKPAPEAEPKPRPAPKRAPEPQQAAGSGGGKQAGQSGSSAAATAQAGKQAELRSIWGARIRARIERRKRYPAGTRGRGQVVVRLTVARSGRLLSHRIAKSSGTAAFDRAALQAVARAGKFPAAPKELGPGQFTFNLPMTFSR